MLISGENRQVSQALSYNERFLARTVDHGGGINIAVTAVNDGVGNILERKINVLGIGIIIHQVVAFSVEGGRYERAAQQLHDLLANGVIGHAYADRFFAL